MSNNFKEMSIEKKVCNALIENANPNFNFYLISFVTSGVVGAIGMGAIMGSFKKMMGGLWVGGTTYLTKEKIIFTPNKLNKMLQSNIDHLEIPLLDIVSIKKEFGVVTGIVRLETENGILKLRCYGASKFMEKIVKTRDIQCGE